MLEIDAAGLATMDAAGSRRARARRGIRFEPLGDHERLGTLVGADEKFAAHNAAAGSTACSSTCAQGRRARAAALRADRQPARRRRSLLAPARRRRGGEPLHRDRGVRRAPARPRLLERGRRALRRAGARGRVRQHPEPGARDLALRLAPRVGGRDAELDWVAGRVRLEEGQGADRATTSPARAQPRGDRRLFRRRRPSTSTSTRSRRTWRPNTTSDFAFKGALSRPGRRPSGAG